MNRSKIVLFLSAVAACGWTAPAMAEGDSEWSIAPRGRIQIDGGWVDAAPAVEAAANTVTPGGLDWDGEVRRAFIGVDGTMPGNLGFRIEGDFANVVEGDSPTWTDAYIYWKATKELRITAGSQKPFWGLEELTSDLFPSMMERAAFNSAFGHERRTGLSAAWSKGPVLVQGGAFLDDLDAIMGGRDQGHSFDGRVVYMPKVGNSQLHVGGSVHVRNFDEPVSIRYSARPFIRTADTRFVNTGGIANSTGETGYGLEAALISGPFHIASEARWQQVSRANALLEPTFFGGYVEAGYFLTKGDTRGYKGGNFDRVKPSKPVGNGGVGALQLNVRYDYLDLSDAGINGGQQTAYGASLIWMPTQTTRILLNYARVELDDAVIAAAGDRSYGVDAFGVRFQFDFY